MTFLSDQQTKCLTLLSQGMTYKEIGSIMNLSPRTIEFYVKIIKEKTQLDKRSQLIQYYFNNLHRTL